TQVQLAEKIGISSNYLSRIERGKREKYSLRVLVMAADALDVPLGALCD
ncbi:MAG: helix-turn-helix transcriptional regulator, partial [Selenomonadales bacterium]|nr:helix-turn-helix transcriptional regulator [Selenomonadales bacterium]